MTHTLSDDTSPVSPQAVVEAYLRAIALIDERVTPFLGRATTRVLVQGSARRIEQTYPFLHFLVIRPYSTITPSLVRDHLAGVEIAELTAGLDALLRECFAGLRELTGDLIVPPIHEEVARQLGQTP